MGAQVPPLTAVRYYCRVKIYKLENSPEDGPLVQFGPIAERKHHQQSIPQTFERTAFNDELALELTIGCAFEGDKILLQKLHAEGEQITSRDMTQLQLPWLIRNVAAEVIPNSYQWDAFVEDLAVMKSSRATGPSDETLFKIAQHYWYDHITWFKPRANIMDRWGISRTTANEWIRRAAKLYPMPGHHAK